MTTRSWLLVSLFAVLVSGGGFGHSATAQMQCPVGTYPWQDNWGNQTCRSFTTQQDVITQTDQTGCPVGSHPWVDEWGNEICQAFDSNKRYYDTSKGCPVGMHPWQDRWGNPTCQPF